MMDDFGVLTERYGLKPKGKSTPMAELKRSVNDGKTRHFGLEDDVNVELTREFSIGSKVDDFLVFDELNKLSTDKNDYLFTEMPVPDSSSVNDILGDFSGLGLGSRELGNNEVGFDELIPGFGEHSNSVTTTWTGTGDDPFEVLESTLVHSSSGLCVETGELYAGSTSPLQTFPSFEFLPRATQKKGISSVDELAKFGIVTLQSTSLDSNNSSKDKEAEDVEEKKSAAPVLILDDLIQLFGADSLPREFEELPGESDKRRIARWEREQRIENQMANVVADLNNRDRQFQIEQEERNRISENLDAEIKVWAAGKEGNIRALLSSLHLVLWPECGWEAVSLTDLITSASVKKVYKKANLYVHPDKVQQEGAEQKYIAEKVFNILQEAWNKFNKEELS